MTTTAFPPQAYIIGAQKAGTTTLAALLGQHPDIVLAEPKETNFYTINGGKGDDWYRQCFSHKTGRVWLDAATSYAAAPVGAASASADPRLGVAARIKARRPDAKIIYSLRDPVSRTYSGYWHHVRNGDETRPFREALEGGSSYLATSLYAHQLDVYLAQFPREQILIVCFEDFRSDLAGIVARCLGFLDLDPAGLAVDDRTAANPSYQYNVIGRLFRAVTPSTAVAEAVTRVVKGVVPAAWHDRLRSLVSSPIPPLSDDDRAFLVDYFRPHNDRLRALTGLSFDRWSA